MFSSANHTGCYPKHLNISSNPQVDWPTFTITFLFRKVSKDIQRYRYFLCHGQTNDCLYTILLEYFSNICLMLSRWWKRRRLTVPILATETLLDWERNASLTCVIRSCLVLTRAWLLPWMVRMSKGRCGNSTVFSQSLRNYFCLVKPRTRKSDWCESEHWQCTQLVVLLRSSRRAGRRSGRASITDWYFIDLISVPSRH